MRICVVGAGFSGLAAAEVAQRAGHEVVVLEGSDGVGGRPTIISDLQWHNSGSPNRTHFHVIRPFYPRLA